MSPLIVAQGLSPKKCHGIYVNDILGASFRCSILYSGKWRPARNRKRNGVKAIDINEHVIKIGYYL